jgi:type I restriction enzyme R subunit
VAQAKNYAGKLAVRFAYSTNGQGIYGIDMTGGTEGEVPRYPTPEELWNLTFAEPNAWRDRFAAVPFEDKGGFFQGATIRTSPSSACWMPSPPAAAHPAHAGHRHRQNLHRLSDRVEALSQPLEPEPRAVAPPAHPVPRRPQHPRRSGLQRLLRLPRGRHGAHRPETSARRASAEERQPVLHHLPDLHERAAEGRKALPYFGEYPPDFFDFIVIDECHRGGANDESNWRGILDYFAPAVQLGLTATPKRKDNVDTYAYFGDPVYIYSLKDGINDGFLTPFKVKQISTTLDEYIYTPDDQLIEGEIETGKRYTEPDFNKIIEIKEREAHRVKLFMEQIDQTEKTLVFCATQDHALAVRDLINQMKTSRDPNYCQRVTANDGALGEQHLRDFQDNEKSIPTILTTSQKLSTGVDARNIRNIVLMRPVNSMIEFKQIIGRGTRLYDGKDYFTIYDFVKAHHHFSDPEWDGEPLEPEPKPEPAPRPVPPPEPDGRARAWSAPAAKIKVKLADGKARTIQHMMVTSFWHPDGTPMSAHQFLEMLFGKLPEFFKDEAELRALWSDPDTRAKLLRRAGGERVRPGADGRDAEDHRRREQRPVRRAGARGLRLAAAHPRGTGRAGQSRHRHPLQHQAAGLPRVRALPIRQGRRGGVGPGKLSPLLKLKYHNAIADAWADLGRPEEVGYMFAGFQKYLYQPGA